MCALLFLERRKVRGQIMANMWMVPQGRVRIPVPGRNFVTVKAWPGCQSIALSLPVRSSRALSSLTACNEKGSNEVHFPWERTFLQLLMPQHFPTQSFSSPLVANRKSSASCSQFPNAGLAAGTAVGLSYGGPVPCSTAYFCCDYWIGIWIPA